jgi:hypothetical protein
MRQMGLAFAFAVLFLVGCSGKHSLVNPEWKNAPDSYTVLVSRPFVGNPDDVADDLPEYTSNFEEWFSAEIATALEKRTEKKPSVKVELDENFNLVPLEFGKETFLQTPIPNMDRISGLHGVVISIHPIKFKRKTEKHYSATGTTANHWLVVNGTYSIVSADEEKILAYGLCYGISSFKFAMTKGDWENVVDDLAKTVIQDTPLEK